MPMWDDEPEYGPGTCVRCGVDLPRGLVRWVTRSSGPDVRIVLHDDLTQCTPPDAEPEGRLRSWRPALFTAPPVTP